MQLLGFALHGSISKLEDLELSPSLVTIAWVRKDTTGEDTPCALDSSSLTVRWDNGANCKIMKSSLTIVWQWTIISSGSTTTRPISSCWWHNWLLPAPKNHMHTEEMDCVVQRYKHSAYTRITFVMGNWALPLTVNIQKPWTFEYFYWWSTTCKANPNPNPWGIWLRIHLSVVRHMFVQVTTYTPYHNNQKGLHAAKS